MRFEITYRGTIDAEETAAALRASGFSAVNVTDVSRDVDAMGFAVALRAAAPDLDVMAHVSAKHHGDADGFVRQVKRGYDGGLRKFLVVSGHPRRAFDALAALAALGSSALDTSAYCVHNPFFGSERQKEEDERLAAKLSSGRVRGISLQIGFDEGVIRDAARRIRARRPDVEVLASVPVPTEGLLRRLATKALYGVSLPASYFLSAKAAEEATRRVLAVYKEEGITPLAFAFGADRATIEQAARLRDGVGWK